MDNYEYMVIHAPPDSILLMPWECGPGATHLDQGFLLESSESDL
jgi:hypothetical protein